MRLLSGFRLFYDIPSTVRRAEFVLLLSDFLLIIAPVCFVAAVPYRDAPVVEGFLLGLWAIVPRSMARYVGWLGRPQDTLHSTSLSGVFIFMTAGLILAGWELLYQSAPYSVPLGLGTALLVILAWAANFLLFQPRAYRIVDFLTGGVILLGLFEHKPLPWLWVSVYFVALTFSATTRHFLYDVYNRAPSRWINLQNLRALSTTGTLLAIGSFFVTVLLLNGALSFPETPQGTLANRARPRNAQLLVWPASATPNADEAQRGFLRQSPDLRAADEEDGDGLRSARRFSYRGDLAKLARKPNNTTPILTVNRHAMIRGDGTLVSDVPDDLDPELTWPPPKSTRDRLLHRAVTFSVFDPENHSWGEGALRDEEWPRDKQMLTVDPALNDKDVLFLAYNVQHRVFPGYVSLYRTQGYRSVTPSRYRTNNAGVVIPSKPSLERGDTYYSFVRPLMSNSTPAGAAPGPHPSEPTTLEIPSEAELGFALTDLAKDVFADDGDPVVSLHAYFKRERFSYAKYRFWQTSGSVLEDFLLKEKAGNCSYYATAAALLLRAHGVSTRVGAGFVGGRWKPDLEELWLEYGMLHAWVEVYYPGRGWYPIDPTLWVPFNELGNPPEPDDSDSSAIGRQLASNAQSGFFDAQARQNLTGSFDATDTSGQDGRPLVDSRHEQRLRPEQITVEQVDEELGEWIDFEAEGPRDTGSDPLAYREGASLSLNPSAGGGSLRRTRHAPESNQESKASFAFWREFKVPLRWLLIVLSGVAVVLLLVSFLRTRKEDEEEEDNDEDVDEAGDGDWPLPGKATLEFDWTRPREAIIGNYYALQEDLRLTRNHRLGAQTPLEHGRRLLHFHSSLRDALKTVVLLFYKALYGSRKISSQDAEAFETSCRTIKKALR